MWADAAAQIHGEWPLGPAGRGAGVKPLCLPWARAWGVPGCTPHSAFAALKCHLWKPSLGEGKNLSEATQLCQPRVGCSGVTREPRHALALPIRVSSRAQNGEPSGGQGGLSPCQVQACGAAVLRWHGLLPRPGRPVHGKSRLPRVGPRPQRERTQPVSRGCEVEPPPLRAGETEARRVSATPPNRQQTLRAPPG